MNGGLLGLNNFVLYFRVYILLISWNLYLYTTQNQKLVGIMRAEQKYSISTMKKTIGHCA